MTLRLSVFARPMKTDHPIYLFLSAGAEAFRTPWPASRITPM